MLRYFPELLPDELFYSTLGRYSSQTGTRDFKPVVKEIFGTENVIATWEFPSHIGHFVGNLDYGHCYRAEDIIFANTMLPLFFPFIDKERQQYALEHMKGNNGKGIHMKLGAMASKIKVLNSLKYCPLCISEDIKNYRVAYWHRSHNAVGTIICHKHAVLLRDNCPLCGVVIASKSKNEFFSLDDKCPNGHSLTIAEKNECPYYDKELRIAKAVYYLLNTDLMNCNARLVQKTYIRWLYEKNLITPKGSISHAELIEQFLLYYSDSFLQQLGLNIETKSGESWLSSIIRRQDRVAHPLKHILLINFLAGDMFHFFKLSLGEYRPFGDPPWLCLNPAVNHYRKPIVTICRITRCTDTKKPVGRFECECGFIYSRRGPDTCNEDKYKVGRIKAFGAAWEDKLRSLAQEKDKSLRSIAREMKADTNTIIKYLRIFELPGNCSPSDHTEDGLCTSVLQDELCRQYRDNIVNYINENNQASRGMVRSEFQKEYAWLYRHNKELLYSILPKPELLEEFKPSLRVDWELKDLQIVELTKKEIQRILSADKPERIAVGRIGKNLGLSSILQQHLDKLPKTKRLLDEFTETTDDFQIRRAKSVISSMILRDEQIRPWVVYRRAGLGIRCSEKVKREIFEEIPLLKGRYTYKDLSLLEHQSGGDYSPIRH